MKTSHISRLGVNLDYLAASKLAVLLAKRDSSVIDPMIVAWRDKKTSRVSPVIGDCVSKTSWREYGENHGGKLEVDVNGEFDFIFADSNTFESYSSRPYVNEIAQEDRVDPQCGTKNADKLKCQRQIVEQACVLGTSRLTQINTELVELKSEIKVLMANSPTSPSASMQNWPIEIAQAHVVDSLYGTKTADKLKYQRRLAEQASTLANAQCFDFNAVADEVRWRVFCLEAERKYITGYCGY